jgi:C-terminal processing protease CtpA/Prc
VLALGFLCVATGAATAQEPRQSFTRADYVADLAELTRLARERWSYAQHRSELSGVDLEALERVAVERVGDTPNESDFLHALEGYVAGMQDGHAWVAWGRRTTIEPHGWPFHVREVREGFLIDAVAEGIHAVRPGDLLLRVDGRPVEELVRAAEARVFASTDRARRSAALRRIATWGPSPRVHLHLVREGEGEVEASVSARDRAACDSVWPLDAPTTEHRFLAEGIAYFRPGSFSWPADAQWVGASPEERESILARSYETYARVFEELAGARVLILDLRGNPGGTDLLGQALAGHLMEPGFVYFQLSAQREGETEWHAPAVIRPPVEPRVPRFLGKLVCLIDEGVFSTADNLAVCLRDEHPDVTFVGRPTGAGTGAPMAFTLPHTNASVTFCTHRVYGPAGGYVEGIGVTPDEPVEWTRADWVAGRDPDLEAALVLARE